MKTKNLTYQKIIGAVLMFIMIFQLLPVNIAYAEETMTDDNSCTWYLSSSGAIDFGGNGYWDSDKGEYVEPPIIDLTIPASVNGKQTISIGTSCFSTNTNIMNITIPEGIQAIEGGAFERSTLQHLVIPSTVTDIAVDAFAGCSTITGFEVAAGNTNYSSKDGILFNKEGTELIAFPSGKTGHYEADSVYVVKPLAFSCTNLTSINFKDVVSFDSYIFRQYSTPMFNISNIKTIEIGENVINIGYNAFDFYGNSGSYSEPELISFNMTKSDFDKNVTIGTMNGVPVWNTTSAEVRYLPEESNNEGTYTIEYYYNGERDETESITGTVDIDTVIDVYPEKIMHGENAVRFIKVENFPLAVTKNGNNTIKVYHELVNAGLHTYVEEDGNLGSFNEVQFPDVQPEMVDNVMVMPIHFIHEQIGADIYWDVASQTAYVLREYDWKGKHYSTQLEFKDGSSQMKVNGVTIDIGATLKIVEPGRCLLPGQYIIRGYYDWLYRLEHPDGNTWNSYYFRSKYLMSTPDNKFPDIPEDFIPSVPDDAVEITPDNEEDVFKPDTSSDKVNYTVETYFDNVLQSERTKNLQGTEGDVIKASDINVASYSTHDYDHMEGAPLTLTKGTENVIKLFYTAKNSGDNDENKVNYIVEYYYDNVLDESMTKNIQKNVGDRVTGVPSGAREHYEFKSISVNIPQKPPFNLTADMNNNLVFKAYYESIKVPVKVEYYVDGVKNDALTETVDVIEETQLTEVPNKAGINEEPADGSTPLPYTPTGTDDIVSVYYKTAVYYTVHYFYDGIEDTSKIENIKAYHGDNITNVPNKTYGDYIHNRTENLPITLDKNRTDVVNIYYVTKTVDVPVKYYVDGIEEPTLNYTLKDQKVGSTITKVEDKTSVYYEFDHYTGLPCTVVDSNTKNTIKVYYKTKVNYTVKYFIDDNEMFDKQYSASGTHGQVISSVTEPNFSNVTLASSNLPYTLDKNLTNNEIVMRYNTIKKNVTVLYTIDGTVNPTMTYTIDNQNVGTVITNVEDKTNGLYTKLSDDLPYTVENKDNNIINVIYKTIEKNVTVRYKIDGIIDESLTYTINNQKVNTVIHTVQDKTNGIYRKLSDNLPYTVRNADDNEIIVEYATIKKNVSAFYYVDGTAIPAMTYIIPNQNVGTVINEVTDKTDGKYIEVSKNVPYTVVNSDSNVITVYYNTIKKNVTVKYLIDDVLDDTLTYSINNQKVGTVITEVEDKTGTNYNKVSDNLPYTVVNSDNNEIIVKYETKKVKVKVEYEVDGEVDPTLTEEVEVKITETVNDVPDKTGTTMKEIPGGTELPYTPTGTDDAITVKYKTIVNYTVNYYYDGTADESKKDVIKGYHNDIVSNVADKANGYVIDRYETLPMTLDKNGTNVINVYYVTPEAPYTVKYFIDGVEDETMKYISNAKRDDIISSVTDKTGNKYEFDHTENLPLTITEDGDNIIKVYYNTIKKNITVKYEVDGIVDETMTYTIDNQKVDTVIIEVEDKTDNKYTKVSDNLPYTVENKDDNTIVVKYSSIKKDVIVKYEVNGEIDNTLTYTIKSQKVGDVINTVEDKTDGIYAKFSDNLPYTVENKDDNTIIIKYISITKTVTVKYEVDGKINKEMTYTIDSQKINTIITNVEDKTNNIYNKVSDNLPYTVRNADDNEIIVVYETKKVKVKVEYEVDGEVDPTLTEEVEVKVTETVKEVPDKTGEDKEPADGSTPLPYTPTGTDDVITVKYKTIVNYTVNYYYDGTADESKKDVIKGYHGDVISSVSDKANGYTHSKTETLPMTLDKNVVNIINVYYITPGASYTVKYFIDGVEDKNLEYMKNSKVDSVIDVVADKTNNKYTADHTENLPLTIAKDGDNVIKVYYNSIKKDVTVKYEIDGKVDDSLTYEIKDKKVGDIITEVEDKTNGVYEIAEDTLPYTVENKDDNVIIVKYKTKVVVTEYGTYNIHYYYDGIRDDSKTETIQEVVGTSITTYPDKSGSYVLDKVKGLPMVVVKSENGIVEVYYKTKSTTGGGSSITYRTYTVEYYYDGVKDDNKTESRRIAVETTIKTYNKKEISGYELDREENLPLRVTRNGENVIRIYYKTIVKDVTVEYYIDGVLDNRLTDIYNVKVGTVINNVNDKTGDKYTLDHIAGLPLKVVESGENTIRVYYKTKVIETPEPTPPIDTVDPTDPPKDPTPTPSDTPDPTPTPLPEPAPDTTPTSIPEPDPDRPPQTGTDENVSTYIMLLGGSLVAILILGFALLKKKNDE